MSFSYDINLADNISQVRFYLNDTIELGAYFQDEELSFLLSQNNSSVPAATAEAAFRLWTQFTSQATVAEIDDIRVENRDKAKWFKHVYEEFKEKALKNKTAPIIIGGGDRDAFIERNEGRSREDRTSNQTNTFFDLEL